MSNFCKIPNQTWCLDTAIPKARRDRLCDPPSFEGIVSMILEKASIHECLWEPPDNGSCSTYKRFTVVLAVDEIALDYFHNSRAGYRAQFLRRRKLGEEANQYALDRIIPAIESLLREEYRDCDWILDSVLGRETKIRIHQGLWIRGRGGQIVHRNLDVKKWRDNAGGDPDAKRKVGLGRLTPNSEYRLQIIGTFRNPRGQSLNPSTKNRSEEIHKYGFT